MLLTETIRVAFSALSANRLRSLLTMLGIVIGSFAASQMQRTMGWNTSVDFPSIVFAFSFASGIGLIFGVLPARRAALLDPIEALSYD